MKPYISILSLFLFISCQTGTTKDTTNIHTGDTLALPDSLTGEVMTADPDSAYSDLATYFIVMPDTGQDYWALHTKMLSLNKSLNLPIDTMGRYYNKTKKLIALPDNDEDEMWAGEYYPRRSPSEHLSLEYLHFFQPNAPQKTIALVSGIYENEKGADSAVAALKTAGIGALKLKSEVFIGCMH